jgi:hypothetical protein
VAAGFMWLLIIIASNPHFVEIIGDSQKNKKLVENIAT